MQALARMLKRYGEAPGMRDADAERVLIPYGAPTPKGRSMLMLKRMLNTYGVPSPVGMADVDADAEPATLWVIGRHPIKGMADADADADADTWKAAVPQRDAGG